MLNEEIKTRLNDLTNSANIMLFMKGDKFLPKCGFSAQVVKILKELEAEFTTFDILEDEEVRQMLKLHSQWPTYPQLYVKGELVGGCDIIIEMFESGELSDLLNSK